MASVSIRHLITKPGANATRRYFWQPSSKLRARGWRAVRLADAQMIAFTQAEAINTVLDLWRDDPATPHEAPQQYLPVVLSAAPAGVVRGDNRKPDGKKVRRAVPHGTLTALIGLYRISDEFRDLAAKTRKSYEDNIRTLLLWDKASGFPPIEFIGPKNLKDLWKSLRVRTPSKATATIGMARTLFKWGRSEGVYNGYVTYGDGGVAVRVPQNPASELGLKQKTVKRSENDLWTDDEVEIFSAVAEHMGWFSIGTAVEINAWCGQRQGDVLAFLRENYRNGCLKIRQNKTGATVSLPVDLVPRLPGRIEEQIVRNRKYYKGQAAAAANIEQISPYLIVCETTGQRWQADHFRHEFADIRATAAKWCPTLAKRQFMLLRHTAVVRLAEAGCEIPEIAAVTGHTLASVTTILTRYLVRTTRQAENAFGKRLLAETAE